MKYRASAFHPSFRPRTATGTLEILGDRIRFESELGQAELPCDGLSVRTGGNDDLQLFFAHPNHPDWSIYTSDFKVLEDPALRPFPDLRRHIQAIRKRPKFSGALILLVVLLVAALAVGLVLAASKDRMVRFLAFQIPEQWEVELGNKLFDQIKNEGRIIEDAELRQQLEIITRQLVPVLGETTYPFQFHILNDTNINAFAIPGGNVVVLTGLLQAADRPEEVAGVLAHEIAHVTQRHGFRKIIDQVGLYLLLQAILGDSSGLTAVIAESSQYLLQQKYSRDFEREADEVGWQYLIQANIDPRGLIEFFKRLNRLEQNSPSMPALLSTHPATSERIKSLEAKWNGLERKTGFVDLSESQTQK